MRLVPVAIAVVAVIGGTAAAQPLPQGGERERPAIERGGGGDRGPRMERPELDRGGGRERALERQTDRAVERSQERPQRAEPREQFRERPKPQREEQRRERDRPRAERQQREDAVRERKQQAEQDRDRERAATQAEERRAREEERRQGERDKARQAEERKLHEEERRPAERNRDGRELENRAATKEDRERAEREFERDRERLRLSDPERIRLRDTIEREHGVLKHGVSRDVDFPISVGVHVPRHVRLHPIPVDLVEVVPAYRSYRYFIVEDYICIVDPETYVIVEVIDKERPAAELAVLELAEWERDYVRRHVSWENAQADARIEPALGVDIPERVELHRFSDEILSEIPKLRHYRYVVVENNVVICNPETRDVVLVISS